MDNKYNLFDKEKYLGKNIKNYEGFNFKIKEQTKFHFVPSFIIKNHCKDKIFRLNLISHKIDKVFQSDFINYVSKDDWINKYFSIIEACSAKSNYEEIIKNFITNNKLKSDIDLLENSKYGNDIIEAIVFIVMRNMQFSNEDELFGEIDQKLKIIKTNKFKDNKSMMIEYILKCLLWFGRKTDLDNFIEELILITNQQKFEENNEYTFFINNIEDDNWFDKYMTFYNYVQHDIEYALVSSNPILKSKLPKGFPMLDQPISKWEFVVASKEIALINPIEFTSFYIQDTPGSFLFIVPLDSIGGILLLHDELIKENNLHDAINPAAKISNVIRKSLFFDYQDLHFVYHSDMDYLDNLKRKYLEIKKMPIGFFKITSKIDDDSNNELNPNEYKIF